MKETKTVKTRRNYDSDFKQEVTRMLVSGRRAKEVSESFGIAENLLYRCHTMPIPIVLDSLHTKPTAFGDGTDIVALYDDSVGQGNFYHLVLTVQDSLSKEIYLHNDKINKGATVTHVLNNDIDINTGDTITVKLHCIDTDVYDFYYSLDQALKQNSAVISNPKTNIRGGAMGYFCAHTVRVRRFVFR